ncbi:MAG: phosphopyruvate hydratase [Pelagibacterales bacterium]|nr:phosphopyruvate hydratase [Pelagibacterales bacterium]OUU61286.1 MAG: phosphopyruvate hydratase [Alphaproteobacteria bacterium TMED62]|tara:strand:- start:1486 stop:2757 length:1272 start_codon:yes stop_codon:yes gene_type:complete
MSIIENLKAYEILDSRGVPTLLTEIILDTGIKGCASVPSGASTGIHEALELRDKDKKRYNGKGVLTNIDIINSSILDAIQGLDVRDQKNIDSILLKLDGTKNKSKLGSNTLLSVSLAIAKTASIIDDVELYQYLGGINTNFLPIPLVNVINGGAHAYNNLDIQEYMLAPLGAKTFNEAIRWCSEIFFNLKELLKSNNYSTSVGDEGGFAPNFKNNYEPLEFLIKAIKKSKLNPEKDVKISLDVASSEFYKQNKYLLSASNKSLVSDKMVDFLTDIEKKYPIFSIEDGCAEDDWKGWINLNSKLSHHVYIVGDDLFVTNKNRLEKGIKINAANAILVKPNQIGTLTETLDTISLAKENNIETIISHRSGETEDNFIADLSVGTNSKMIKTGSVTRSERCSKYNRLLVIERNNNNLTYAGHLLNV